MTELVLGANLSELLHSNIDGGRSTGQAAADASKVFLPSAHVWHIGIGVASALEHVGNTGWVHCDVKSANVLLSCEWGVKLCDFGLASRAFQSQTFLSHALSLSLQTSPIAGSPGWMTPEVLNGHTPDPKADIFSLGVLIWEVVTGGQFPWHDKSSSQIRESSPCPGCCPSVCVFYCHLKELSVGQAPRPYNLPSKTAREKGGNRKPKRKRTDSPSPSRSRANISRETSIQPL